jgi:hypothetical protein
VGWKCFRRQKPVPVVRNRSRTAQRLDDVITSTEGSRGRSRLRHYATNRKATGSIPDGSLVFMDLSFQPHCGPGDDSASNRHKYQEYILEVKAAGA